MDAHTTQLSADPAETYQPVSVRSLSQFSLLFHRCQLFEVPLCFRICHAQPSPHTQSSNHSSDSSAAYIIQYQLFERTQIQVSSHFKVHRYEMQEFVYDSLQDDRERRGKKGRTK